MQEAVFNGCFPIVPDRLSYSEMYPACCKYNTWSELIDILECFAKDRDNYKKKINYWTDRLEYKGKQAITNMVDAMKLM